MNHAATLEQLKAQRRPRTSWSTLCVWGLICAALAWSWRGAEMNPGALVEGAGNMATLTGDFFPPNFRDWRFYLDEMIVTLHIAVWGTVLAILFSIPLSILASANITPWWVHQPVRRFCDVLRATNEMVFAMLFVVAVGLGPFAGALAIFVHNTGVISKLFSEAVEAIDPRPVEGIRATGANALEEVLFGVIPQVMPLWASYMLYRFETNVRAATVVGIVGAGGIGVVLWELIRGFYFDQACAAMAIVIVTVTAIDIVSSRVRKHLI